MGESEDDRVGMMHTLATLPEHPESVPINLLVQVEGTPLADSRADRSDRFRPHGRGGAHHDAADPMVRLSAGRESMSDETQALCFLAGANSIFYGREAADHAEPDGQPRRCALFERLGMQPMPR